MPFPVKVIILISSSFVLAFITALGADRLLGRYLSSKGLFKAMPPSSSAFFQTPEYRVKIKISSQGLRGDPVSPRNAGTKRVLAVGDSLTFGWGVDTPQTWVKILENNLNGRSENYEIINAGVPGMSPFEEFPVCLGYKERFGADAVILTLYVSEDLYRLAGNKPRKLSFLFPYFHLLRYPFSGNPFEKISPSNTAIDMKNIWQIRARDCLKKNPGLSQSLPYEIYDLFSAGNLNPSLVEDAAKNPGMRIGMLNPDLREKALNNLRFLIREFKKICAGNTPLFLISIPPAEMASRDYFPNLEKIGFRLDERLLSLDLDGPIGRIAGEEGIPFFSLTENFRSDGCPGCFYPLDGHLTAAGNKRVADVLTDKLKNKL